MKTGKMATKSTMTKTTAKSGAMKPMRNMTTTTKTTMKKGKTGCACGG